MKKNNKLIWIFFTIFIIWFSATMFIVYKDIDHSFATKVVIGFVLYALLFFICILIASFTKLRKLDNKNIKKRAIKFIITFIGMSMFLYIMNTFFPKDHSSFLNSLPIAFGSALGVSFMDIIFITE